jgi:site-specific DNA-methyltransferase (adenine-specific)
MNAVAKPEWWSSDHWATPREIVDNLEAEFGAFDLDPCCMHGTAKARHFYTPVENGLEWPWVGRVFLNPPYSKPAPWLQKAIAETSSGCAALVVALLPVRTDTRWFHELVNMRAELRFIRGRIKWIGWQGTPIPNPKDPSMLAIYRSSHALRR